MTKNPFNKEIFLKQAVEISAKELMNIGSCLVLAPHPDDESLGCGGLIATFRKNKADVRVVVTTDGSQSHPNSKVFPPEIVVQIRKKEVLEALEILGVSEEKVSFFNGKDASLPSQSEEGFASLANELSDVIKSFQPQLILVPYQLDPHCDHRATWQILQQALKENNPIRVWEYPIWLYELASESDVPILKSGELKKVNVGEFLKQKKHAIARHVSQTTKMIDDDPTGFILTEEVIGHFTTKFEYFIEIL